MKTRLQILMTMGMLLLTAFSFSQTVVNSLASFQTAVQNSNQQIVLQAGNYYLEDLPSGSRVINCSGSNNTIDMTGARIYTLVGSIRETYFIISGSNNIINNGAIEDYYASGQSDNITDYSAYNNDATLAYGLKGAAVVSVYGDDNQVIGLELIVRGSYPYGYGSIYGIGSDKTFSHSKRCGLLISGKDGGGQGNTLDGVTMYQNAFGHGIYIQNGAGNSIIKNCYVEGRMRLSDDLYNDTNTYDYPYRSNYEIAAPGTPFAMPFASPIPIPLDVMYPLSEDGIRSYGGTGAITVENCTVKQMRGGIRTYLASSATVTNCISTDCGLTNFNVNNSGEITQSSGNFTFAPIMDVPLNRSGQDIELTILPSPEAVGPHNIADIDGNNHTITFHRTDGPIDNQETRVIVISGNNSTIVNETEYTIVLESGTSGNTVTSCGPVTDNGSNSVTLTSGCFNYDIGVIQAEGYNDMSGIQTETCSDVDGGFNVGYIDNGDWMEYEVEIPYSGSYTVNYRIASKNGGGSVQFKENGTTKATTAIAATGNWQNWATLSTSVSLSAGTQTIQLYAASGKWNINWFEIVPNFTCPSFSTIEAEDFDSMFGIVDEGANIGNIHNGDWTMYSNIDLTCAASINVRASSRNNSGNVEVRLGSTTGTLIGTVAIATTGNWNTWQESSTTLSSVTGIHDVYLVFTGGSSYLFNVDWIEFSDSSTPQSSIEKSVELPLSFEDKTISPSLINNLLTIDNLDSNFNELVIYNYSGVVMINETIINKEKATIDINHLPQGLYILRLNGIDSSKTFKFTKN